jgi:hypothetical protein
MSQQQEKICFLSICESMKELELFWTILAVGGGYKYDWKENGYDGDI